jgi:multimeric flavodoxin WrbA
MILKEILVVYHSQTNHTHKMAQAVFNGASSIKGIQTTLKRANETGPDDLLRCSGLAIGSPEYFGYMSGMIKDMFDRTYEDTHDKKEMFRKPYVLFISAGNDGTGALNSIRRILKGYRLKEVYEPVIAKGETDNTVLDRCEELGKVIAAGCEAGIY